MEITPITYTGFTNGETGLSIRSKINSLGDDVSILSGELSVIDTIQSDINTIEGRVTVLEESHIDNVVSIYSGPRATQVLIPDTAEVLEWMDTAIVDIGTSITHNLLSHNITVVDAGVYKVFGTISITAPLNDIVEIELYIDNLPTGFIASAIGRGNTSIVTFTNAFMNRFLVNDEITLYVKSTGSSITLHSSTMTVEKTSY